MVDAILDPHVLEAPSEQSDSEECYRFVACLLDCRTVQREEWVTVVKPKDVESLLETGGLLPTRDRLSRSFSSCGFTMFSPNDVERVVWPLLDRCVSAESQFPIADLLYASEEFRPDLPSGHRHRALLGKLKDTLVMMALLQERFGHEFTLAALCTHAWDGLASLR
ncbi:MAG: hypothetical protein ACRD2L_15200 [Terriglobia bacterium]